MVSDRLAQMQHNEAVELIQRRRLQILLHSALYYRMNENIVSDHFYDRITKELAQLQTDYPQAAAEAVHADAFADFDGSTGFHLPTGEPALVSRAQHILDYHKRRGK